jgi:hypothetical protein
MDARRAGQAAIAGGRLVTVAALTDRHGLPGVALMRARQRWPFRRVAAYPDVALEELHRYSLAEYHGLVEAGAFEDAHVELFEGSARRCEPEDCATRAGGAAAGSPAHAWHRRQPVRGRHREPG